MSKVYERRSRGYPVSTGPRNRRRTMTAHRRYGTPARSVRVPDDLWNKAKAKARARTWRGKPAEESVSEVIIRALERYVAEPTAWWNPDEAAPVGVSAVFVEPEAKAS